MTKSEHISHKKEFINWVVNSNQKIMFSYKTMKRIVGKNYELIRDEMIEDNDIQLIRPNFFSTSNFKGELIKTYYSAIYKSNINTSNIDHNFYFQKLLLLAKDNKLPQNDHKRIKHILDSIDSTISRTTIDGKNISKDYFKFKGNRFYSDYVNFKKDIRKKIKIDNQKTISFDLSAAQVQLLLDNNQIFDHDLWYYFKESKDFWLEESKKLGLSREETKDLWIKSINGKFINKTLLQLHPTFFGNILNYKQNFGYKSISRLYFQLESKIMLEIMNEMVINKRDFLPVHDCLIVKEKDYEFVSNIFNKHKLKYKIEY